MNRFVPGSYSIALLSLNRQILGPMIVWKTNRQCWLPAVYGRFLVLKPCGKLFESKIALWIKSFRSIPRRLCTGKHANDSKHHESLSLNVTFFGDVALALVTSRDEKLRMTSLQIIKYFITNSWEEKSQNVVSFQLEFQGGHVMLVC